MTGCAFVITEQAFQIDPRHRPVIDEVLSQLEEIAAVKDISLSSQSSPPMQRQHPKLEAQLSSSSDGL